MIRAEDIKRSFGKKEALRGLSLHIPEGEIFGLVGPNGAGKTTAIRIMTGLILPTSGRAFIAGFDIAEEPLKAKAGLGYVPDRSFLYERLTAREHMIFTASVHNMPKADAVPSIESLISEFGMSEYADELIEGYSQGMRQRLLFASALVHKPKALLIDEPFVGLDPIGVIHIKDTMKVLAESGTAILLATHSLHIAGEICHRIGLIRDGLITALKPASEIRSADGGLEGFFLRELGVNPKEGR